VMVKAILVLSAILYFLHTSLYISGISYIFLFVYPFEIECTHTSGHFRTNVHLIEIFSSFLHIYIKTIYHITLYVDNFHFVSVKFSLKSSL
jgi:hypothetical protein